MQISHVITITIQLQKLQIDVWKIKGKNRRKDQMNTVESRHFHYIQLHFKIKQKWCVSPNKKGTQSNGM